ncbi:U-spanin [Klebsiella phage vB_KpnS-VAC9]|nr:U-spanin [Klebsiella phage vB_KpnS-VAC9]
MFFRSRQRPNTPIASITTPTPPISHGIRLPLSLFRISILSAVIWLA